jgi:hypothetical protein
MSLDFDRSVHFVWKGPSRTGKHFTACRLYRPVGQIKVTTVIKNVRCGPCSRWMTERGVGELPETCVCRSVIGLRIPPGLEKTIWRHIDLSKMLFKYDNYLKNQTLSDQVDEMQDTVTMRCFGCKRVFEWDPSLKMPDFSGI